MLHFCGEIRLNHWYRRAAEWHDEPVIKAIYETLARDEARHGGAYLRYMKRALNKVLATRPVQPSPRWVC
jgi:rubrerythrin